MIARLSPAVLAKYRLVSEFYHLPAPTPAAATASSTTRVEDLFTEDEEDAESDEDAEHDKESSVLTSLASSRSPSPVDQASDLFQDQDQPLPSSAARAWSRELSYVDPHDLGRRLEHAQSSGDQQDSLPDHRDRGASKTTPITSKMRDQAAEFSVQEFVQGSSKAGSLNHSMPARKVVPFDRDAVSYCRSLS